MFQEKLGYGHVHDTYLVRNDDGTAAYVLQRINTVAFSNPNELMENILNVTSFISSKGEKTLEFLPFENGSYLKETEDGVFRKMKYIDSISFEATDDKKIIQNIGKAFGSFVKNIADYKGSLHETIPNFHNTKKRLDDCLLAADKNLSGRIDNAKDLINKLEAGYATVCNNYEKLLSSAPPRITHNDTKMNNVLFDRNTKEPICVIDLDTVMNGMTLYDFADCARSLTLIPDNERVIFDQTKYECFKNAFLKETDSILTEDEKANLWIATLTITTELGVRFLEDYLNGDVYFNTSFDTENLLRAKRLLNFVLE